MTEGHKTGGRKLASESRAVEVRERLAAWRRTSEPSRPSLRSLAREIGTSHQLLSHYLRTWDKWEGKEYKRRADGIRERAWAEKRALSPWEESQASAYDSASFQAMITDVLDGAMNKLLTHLKTGHVLTKPELQYVTVAARKGLPTAQRVLDAYGRIDTKNQRNNLPRMTCGNAKSFRRGSGWLATPLKRPHAPSRNKTSISAKSNAVGADRDALP